MLGTGTAGAGTAAPVRLPHRVLPREKDPTATDSAHAYRPILLVDGLLKFQVIWSQVLALLPGYPQLRRSQR